MAKKFLVNIDLSGNQLLNARAHNGTASPTAYGKGQLWFDSTNNIFNVYNGTLFETIATRSYVTGLGYQTSSGSVAYATTANNANTVTNGVYTTDTGTVTSTMIADGTIVNGDISSEAAITPNKLSASALTIAGTTVGLGGTLSSIGVQYLSASNITIGSTAVGLGGTATTIAGLTKITSGSISVSDTSDASSTSTGALVVSGGAGIGKNLYVGGNLNVSGSVSISGSVLTVSSSNITLNDPMLYLAHNNPSNINDLGIIASFNDGTYQHSGLVRDATDNVWKLFSGVTDEPTTTVNFGQAAYDYLKSGGLYINSGTSTTTASISSTGNGYFSGLSISGSAVATQAYVLANSGTGNAVKQAYTISGDSSSTSFVVSHTLNTRDVTVQVYQTSATPDTQYAEVEVDIVRTTASAVTVSFATAPATGTTYNVVIVG